jgi:glycosyltransferase involved in cell wall biosynthesis
MGMRKPKLLLCLEVLRENYARQIREFSRLSQIKLVVFFHDAIPVLHPEFCPDPRVLENHRDYMIGLARCDLIVANSDYSAQCLKNFWTENGVAGTDVVSHILPGEFGEKARVTQLQAPVDDEIKILCVSTLEPRKNHLRLIDACRQMEKKHPELKWSLTLVGNRYLGAENIAEAVEKACAQNPRIRWLGVVDDETLNSLYQECSFTVYPSIIEGFGLPIGESIWYGKPCICHREGVMAEQAAEGGCLMTNMLDVPSMADDIYQMAVDENLRSKLSGEAVAKNVKTWDAYAKEFLEILDNQIHWTNALYAGCTDDQWLLTQTERLSLVGVLSRLDPHCCIEVGSCDEGSLLLMSQYADMVFSIPSDQNLIKKLRHVPNISFINAQQAPGFSLFLKELNSASIPVDFVLIRFDSAGGQMQAAIETILSGGRTKSMVLMIYGASDPECRRVLGRIDWGRSSCVQFVDLDFIPGAANDRQSLAAAGGFAFVFLTAYARRNSTPLVNTANKNRLSL